MDNVDDIIKIPFPEWLKNKMAELVGDMEVDLDEPLDEDGEEE